MFKSIDLATEEALPLKVLLAYRLFSVTLDAQLIEISKTILLNYLTAEDS